MAEIALAWVYAKDAVCCPIVGAGSVSHVENNVRTLAFKLTQDEIETLNGLYRPRDVINDQVSDPVPRHLGGIRTDS